MKLLTPQEVKRSQKKVEKLRKEAEAMGFALYRPRDYDLMPRGQKIILQFGQHRGLIGLEPHPLKLNWEYIGPASHHDR